MNKQGIKTKQKGVCWVCSKPILGQVITALGKTWHLGCFTCNQCNQELGTQNFFERDGKPFCEHYYHSLLVQDVMFSWEMMDSMKKMKQPIVKIAILGSLLPNVVVATCQLWRTIYLL